MKRVLMIIVLICIILLIAIDVKIMLNIANINSDLNSQVDLLQSQINDLKMESDKIQIEND